MASSEARKKASKKYYEKNKKLILKTAKIKFENNREELSKQRKKYRENKKEKKELIYNKIKGV